MSAQGAGGAADQNPGRGARPAQQVQGILSLVPAGPQLVPAAAQRRGGGRPRGALNQSTRRANAATARRAGQQGGARHARAVRAPMCHGALYWEPG